MTKCEYQNCKAEAIFKLGLADPDSKGNYYCEGHCEIRKKEIFLEIFGWRAKRCAIIRPNGKQCLNSQKFGKLCGIHNRQISR